MSPKLSQVPINCPTLNSGNTKLFPLQAISIISQESGTGDIRCVKKGRDKQSDVCQITGRRCKLMEALAAAPSASPTSVLNEDFDLDRVAAEFEKTLIQEALTKADGNRTKAARLLNISLKSLQYRIQKHGI